MVKKLDRFVYVLKRIKQAICGAYFTDSCKPLFKKLQILRLPSIYILEICIF